MIRTLIDMCSAIVIGASVGLLHGLLEFGAGCIFAAVFLLALLWWETRKMHDDGEWRE